MLFILIGKEENVSPHNDDTNDLHAFFSHTKQSLFHNNMYK